MTVGGENFTLSDQSNADFTFKRVNKKTVQLTTWFGLMFEHSKLKNNLCLPALYSQSTIGICGNFNFDKNDDFTDSSGNPKDCGIDHPVTGGWSDCEKETNCEFELTGLCKTDHVEDPPTDCHDECEAIFNENWIRPCTDVIDKEKAVESCKLDLCVAEESEKETAVKEILGSFINQCRTKRPGNDAVCNWLNHAGFQPECGLNEIYMGCANVCSDIKSCSDDTMKNCDGVSDTVDR